jgi:hypothetical protein
LPGGGDAGQDQCRFALNPKRADPAAFILRLLLSWQREAVVDRNKRRLNRHLDRWQGHLPDWAEGAMGWLRKPSSRWVRIPIGLLLIAAGLVGVFLPVLGFWMVVPGLLLLATDVPFLRRPLRIVIVWIRHLARRLRRRRARRG